MATKDLAGARDYGLWQARKPRDFDSIAFIRAPWLDAPQKHDLAARLLHGNVHIFHSGQELLQFRQFVIMRGEERSRSRSGVKRFHNSPRNREAVEGSRAAANLIEEDKAGGRRSEERRVGKACRSRR